MNVRFQNIWTSIDGQKYRVSIFDDEFIGEITKMNIGLDSYDGLTITYDSISDRFAPILASKCNVNISIDNDTINTLITDILSSQEERFYLKIEKYNGSDYDLFWLGIILQELGNIEDKAYPFMFTLTAADCLGRLSQINYDNDGDFYTGRESFLEHIFKILEKTNLMQFFDADQEFLLTSVNWYEKDMDSGIDFENDPLDFSSADHNNFIVSENGTLSAMKCYEVLKQICLNFNARIFFADGKFQFLQINEYFTAEQIIRGYNKSATRVTGELLSLSKSEFSRKGFWSFLPSIYSTNVIYNYKSAENLGDFLPENAALSVLYNCGNVTGGGGESLIFNGIINEIMEAGEIFFHYLSYEIYLKIGNYYFTNKNGVAEWSTNSEDRYYYNTDLKHTDPYNEDANIQFDIPNIPTTDTMYFEIKFFRFEYPQGTPINPPEGSTYSQTAKKLIIYADFSENSGSKKFITWNYVTGEKSKSKSILELPDKIIGDGPLIYSCSKIQIKKSDGNWQDSANWNVAGLPLTKNINKLLTDEVMAGQKYSLRKYIGEITAEMSAANTIVIDGKKYLFMGGTFNANYNAWNGEWIEIQVNRN